MNIQKAMDACIAELSLSANTAKSYRNGMRVFANFLRERGVETAEEVARLNIDHFVFFYSWLDQHYAKQTAGVYSAASRSLMDWLIVAGHIHMDYLDEIRFKNAAKKSHRRHEDKLPRFPKKDDVERMLYAVHAYTDESPRRERNIALLEFLASSGCRNSEAIHLNVQDIDLENRSTIVTGKGSKDRRVFFSTAAADALKVYWAARRSSMPTDPAFARHDRGAGNKRIKRLTAASTRNIVKQIAAIAGIDETKFSPHYFRHAFAIRVLSETGNLALTQDLLGHTDPKSTRVYAKIHAEDLRKAHEKIFK